MKKDTVKRELHQHDGYYELVDHIADLLPGEADFAIFQIDPDGSIQVLQPIQRPGFSEAELKDHIGSNATTREAFQQLTEFLSEPILLEISNDGDLNKISVPDNS